MCFKTSTLPKKQIAAKDIICYKICTKKNDKYYSMYHYKQYKLGKTYRLYKKLQVEKIGVMAPYEYNINKGFHSYINFKTVQLDYRYYNAYKNEILCICKFIIPKGSTYYEDYLEQVYVSNKIKFIKEINYLICVLLVKLYQRKK